MFFLGPYGQILAATCLSVVSLVRIWSLVLQGSFLTFLFCFQLEDQPTATTFAGSWKMKALDLFAQVDLGQAAL